MGMRSRVVIVGFLMGGNEKEEEGEEGSLAWCWGKEYSV